MKDIRAPRAGVACAAALVLALLTGCSTPTEGTATTTSGSATAAPTTSTTPPPPPPPVIIPSADLPKYLLPAEEVAAALSVPSVVPRPDDYTVFTEFPPGWTFDPPECVSAAYAQVKSSYDNSGAIATNGGAFADNLDRPIARFEQLLVTFPDAAAADAYVDRVEQQWKTCAGKTFRDSGNPTDWVIGQPTRTPDGIALLSLVAPKTTTGWSMVRGVAAKDNVVIDTNTSAPDLTSAPVVQLIKAIQARMPGH